MKYIAILLPLVILINSCVPPNKFKALQTESLTCVEERDRLKTEMEQLSVDYKEMKALLAQMETDLARAEKDTLRLKEEVTRLNRENRQLTNDYADLQEAQQALLKGSEVEIRRLMEELQATQKEKNARLAELEQILQEQQSAVAALRKTVSDALMGFENQGLAVTQKNGKVYVSLEEKLLFKSGSTVVDPKGAAALKKLSGVLEQNPDINVMIEGHTDDVLVIAGSTYKDNWDLSVLRATSIVRILLDGSKINPERLTTAGRSQYQPVDPSKTAESRQKNRRTEIILSPKLDELYKLVEGK
jgi:chemotaxis protein MotB